MEVEEVLRRRQGVCQDFAHLAVAMCRCLDIPARYVSRYLFTVDESVPQLPASGAVEDEPDAVRVQTHAWFEAAVPGFGWLALDPTNGADVGLRHVKIGHGRDYDDVPPLRGVFAGPAHCDLEVTVDIRRLGSPAPLPPLAERTTRQDREAASRSEDEALRRAADSEQQQQQ
ncbi:MAG: transglutaminase-like domain-containing protein [Acidimicrobiales bacterium]